MKRRLDLTGQQFGRLVAIAPDGYTASGKTAWLCECGCGERVQVETYKLRSGHTTSCGCWRREKLAQGRAAAHANRPARICSIEGCDRPVTSHGWCRSHWKRWKRWGDPEGGRAGRDTCSIEGCVQLVVGHGWCRLHYDRWRRTGDPNTVRPITGRHPVVEPGERYGRLVVIEFSHTDHCRLYRCVCDCGNEHVAAGPLLKQGVVRSCGCLLSDVMRDRNTTHGLAGTRTYRSWQRMVRRCTNPKAHNFAHYGGASPPVRVCDRWLRFEAFFEDMGERPEGTTLGRFGDVGNYEPGNCAWQTPAEQGVERSKKRAAKRAEP